MIHFSEADSSEMDQSAQWANDFGPMDQMVPDGPKTLVQIDFLIRFKSRIQKFRSGSKMVNSLPLFSQSKSSFDLNENYFCFEILQQRRRF